MMKHASHARCCHHVPVSTAVACCTRARVTPTGNRSSTQAAKIAGLLRLDSFAPCVAPAVACCVASCMKSTACETLLLVTLSEQQQQQWQQ
jgi:hypothetical protein